MSFSRICKCVIVILWKYFFHTLARFYYRVVFIVGTVDRVFVIDRFPGIKNMLLMRFPFVNQKPLSINSFYKSSWKAMAENTDDAIDELKDDNNQEHDYSRPRQRLLTVLGSVVMVVINRFLVYKYLSYGNRLRRTYRNFHLIKEMHL